MSDNKLKVISLGTLNFTNCLPINYSFSKWGLEKIMLSYGYPSLINDLIYNKQLHVSPISSIEYVKNSERYELIDSISISSNGKVGSVILFSKYDFNELSGKKIGIPFDSSSSVALLKILLNENNMSLESIIFKTHKYELTLDNFLQEKFDAILYIGDQALIENLKPANKYLKYDLAEEWFTLTNYPMVFASWVALKEWKIANLDDFDWTSFMLNKSVDAGLNMYLNEIVSEASLKLQINENNIKDYFLNKLDYKFEKKHLESLELFKNLYNRLKE